MRLSKSLRKNKSKALRKRKIKSSRKNKSLKEGSSSNTKNTVLSNYALNAIKRLTNSLTRMEDDNQKKAEKLQTEYNNMYKKEMKEYLEARAEGERERAARILKTREEWEKRQQKLKEENEALKKVIREADSTHDFLGMTK